MFYTNTNIPKATKNILIVNLIMFGATLLNKNFMTMTFALFPPESPFFHWWQLVAHMFMHGGLWHIFFNMYALFMFGCIVERMIGAKKFTIFYFVCGFGAAGLHLLVQHFTHSLVPTVGASGAIYGVLIAYALLFPDSRLTLIFPPVSLTAKWWVVIFAGIELFTGVTGTADGVAHFAHLGGMIIGALLIMFWRKTGTLFDRD